MRLSGIKACVNGEQYKALREQLKSTYPSARVRTLSSGHFPYLNRSTGFTDIIAAFIGEHSKSNFSWEGYQQMLNKL
jgi:hypothetical protein